MRELKQEVHQMGASSQTMIDSLGDTMNYLNSLEEEFMKLRQDAQKLQSMNQDMHQNITRIETTYIKKVVNWFDISTNLYHL